ncbi:UvrD-helicase domain-containing protein [Salinibacter altiplanensis]|uniref:UvrD-helicase domain-containing protein n=1 Tax=Salinibacter altiplanensis TaxID=1803181 RepID=UPI001319F5CE|nr:UvrD-helicase domain-containing protein [Salinibacter altiplanensis]
MSKAVLTDVPDSYDDEPIRQRIGPWKEDGLADLNQFDPDTNFVVTAAAGSGKTTALVARMVALVRQGTPPSDLTAITFTRKAAGEMKTRFFGELERARAQLPNGSAEHERVDRALGSVQSVFIGTIHSFCSRLLRERPLAAGLPPDFNAGLEDRDERQLRERAWQQHLREMDKEDSGALDQLAEYGIDPQELTSFFKRLCDHPELSPYVNAPDEAPALEAAVEEAKEKLHAWDARRPENLSKGRDPVMKAFDKANRMLQYQNLDTPLQQADFLKVFAEVSDDEKADVKNTYWKEENADTKKWAKTLRDELLPTFFANTIQPVLRDWQAKVHKSVVEFTQPAIERYRALRQEEGLLTYHDLLSHTRDLLRDRPGVRKDVQKRYPIFLVDEFQDTDPLQTEILSFLASTDPEEDTWHECSPRDGSLFIVGDDKQSIYRFRRADKGVFENFRERIDKEPNGEAVLLTKNFRSRTPICNWCDRAFSSIFDHPEYRDIQADYVSFDAQRPTGPEGTALRQLPLEKKYRNKGDLIAKQEATRIARFIQAARAGDTEPDFHQSEEGAVFEDGVDFSDFLILTRSKSRLGIYTEVLAQYGIPYTVTGSEDLGDSDELKAVVDLLRCTLRPDDPVAAVAYLKGDLSGWSDEDLYAFEQAGGQFDRMHQPVPDRVLSQLDEGQKARVEGSFKRLRDARRILQQSRPGIGVDQIVETFGLLAGAAHPSDPTTASVRAGAVLRITNYVQHLAAQGLGWGEVIEELDLVLEGEEDIDGMTLETGADNAVRIMNVHQAKGLEAPVVFLSDPYTSGRSPTTKLHLRRDEQEVVAPVVKGESYFERVTHAPLGWYDDTEQAFKGEEERHEEAEERRLLYVAATRAERLLVVSTYPEKPNDGPWSPLYDHLEEADVPELTVPDADPPEHTTTVPAPDLESSKTDREQRLNAHSKSSYSITSISDEKPEAGPLSDDGYGAAFGTVLHQLLEQQVLYRSDPPTFPEAELKNVLANKGGKGTEEAAGRLRAMLSAFRDSKIWKKLLSASTVHTEYEFAYVTTNGELSEGKQDKIRRGTIDLLFKDGEEWTILDFKSDRIGPGVDDLDAALGDDHPYREQIRLYEAAVADLIGEPVKRAALWFADTDTLIEVEK